ncbi:PREDICTED: uncharacterized protein LOC109481886 [Branchiostoma belcheri]|uniref:Uncharacterized protein LOC109481886 n=1 Tax=Branchiostoma belcheri TaxID=7741 RepID=A0A6P5AE75_BRABE|nr:PREDICTED: uncharacterized protein LOC109481886 [Branchiostoma belcheri]
MSTRRVRPRHEPHPPCTSDLQCPITLNSVEAVIAGLKDPKGASAIAIQRSIQAVHPEMEVDRCKALLKAVLLEGLDSGRLRRPPGSKVGRGLVGRFLLKATDGTSAETLTALPESHDGKSAETLVAVPESHDGTSAETLVAVPESHDGTSAETLVAVPESHDGTSAETLVAVPESHDGTSAETLVAVPESHDGTSAETLVAVPESHDGTSAGKLPALPETQDGTSADPEKSTALPEKHDDEENATQLQEEEEDPLVAPGDLTFELEEPCTPAAYIQRVREERDRLVGQCQEAEGYLNYWNLPAHVLDQVRIAVGRSRLITSNARSPLARFEELCREAMILGGDNPYKASMNDLDAYWEVVELEVQKIDKLLHDVHLVVKNAV